MNPQNIKYLLICLMLVCSPCRADHADRDKPVHLEADRVSIDDAKQVSTFEGRVQLSQGTLLIRGDNMVMVQDKDGYTHGTTTGQLASFRQKRDLREEYVEGYAERIEYDSRSETVDLYGQAHMKQAQDDVRGDHITYNSKTEVFQVRGAPPAPANASGKSVDAPNRGRVRVIIQPRNGVPGPAGEPLPIKPSETLIQPEGRQ